MTSIQRHAEVGCFPWDELLRSLSESSWPDQVDQQPGSDQRRRESRSISLPLIQLRPGSLTTSPCPLGPRARYAWLSVRRSRLLDAFPASVNKM